MKNKLINIVTVLVIVIFVLLIGAGLFGGESCDCEKCLRNQDQAQYEYDNNSYWTDGGY